MPALLIFPQIFLVFLFKSASIRVPSLVKKYLLFPRVTNRRQLGQIYERTQLSDVYERSLHSYPGGHHGMAGLQRGSRGGGRFVGLAGR
jgi:hypothetical protein